MSSRPIASRSLLPQAMESSRMTSGVMAETKRKQAMLTFWDRAKNPCSTLPSNHCSSQRSAESSKNENSACTNRGWL